MNQQKAKILNLSQCVLFCLSICFWVPAEAVGQAISQSPRTPAIYDEITLTGGTNSIQNFTIFPYSTQGTGLSGGLAFIRANSTDSNFNITDNSPSAAFAIGQQGVGVGLNAFDPNQSVESTLHVAGGFGGAYPNAHILIDDRNDDGTFRNLMRLRNGGPIGLYLEDTSTPQDWSIATFGGNLNLYNPTEDLTPFSITPSAPDHLMRLATNGVGIGMFNPVAALHVPAPAQATHSRPTSQ